jgi:hypothetical protein
MKVSPVPIMFIYLVEYLFIYLFICIFVYFDELQIQVHHRCPDSKYLRNVSVKTFPGDGTVECWAL